MQDKKERRPALTVWAKWLARYYRRYPHVVAILIVLTPVEAFLTALVPRLVGFTIDYLKTGEVPANRLAREVVSRWGALGLSPPVAFAATFILFGLVSFAIYAYFQGWRAWMNTRLEWDFRQEAFDRMTVKGPDFFARYRTGDLVTRMTDDVAEKLSWFACSGIFRFYEALLGIGFIVVMMIGIDPGLTLWTAGPLPVLILVFFKSSSMLDTRYDRLQRRISSVNDLLEACFSGIRIVKSYVREDAQKREFDRVARERRRAEIASIRATAVIDSLYGSRRARRGCREAPCRGPRWRCRMRSGRRRYAACSESHESGSTG